MINSLHQHLYRLIVHVLRAELAVDGELQDQLTQFRDAVRGFGEGRELLAEGCGGHLNLSGNGLTRRRGGAKKIRSGLFPSRLHAFA